MLPSRSTQLPNIFRSPRLLAFLASAQHQEDQTRTFSSQLCILLTLLQAGTLQVGQLTPHCMLNPAKHGLYLFPTLLFQL